MKQKTVSKHVKPVGFDAEGTLLLGGAFFMHDTVGLPLGEQILAGHDLGVGVSLPHFALDARRAGWIDKTIIKEIREELRFTGGAPDVIDRILGKIQGMLDRG